MVRKQVYIREEQEALLKRTANRRGVTEAELVRDGLDQVLLGRTGTVARDPAAWERLRAAMNRHGTMRTASSPRRWTRRDLYDRPVLR